MSTKAEIQQLREELFLLKTQDEYHRQSLADMLAFSTQLTRNSNLKTLYSESNALALRILKLDYSTLMILSDDYKDLVIRDTIGFTSSMIDSFSLLEGQGLSTFVVQEKKAATVLNFNTEKRFKVPPVVLKENITSALAVPMLIGETVFGILIGHTKSERFFTLEEINLYQSIANQAAVAIKNVMHLQSLQNSESRFSLLLDSLDALVYVADMNTYEVLFINKFGKQMMGDITGKICWQSLQQGQSGPCPFCTNKYLLDKNGQPGDVYTWEFQNTVNKQWFYIRDRAITWSDGRIVRLEIATDITEKKQAEAELSAEKEQLAVTLRSIGDGVITTDISGNIVLLNKVAEKLTGWSAKEAYGRPLAEVFRIIHEQTRELCENPVTKVLSSGQIIGLANHTILVAKDGNELSIADSGAPILDNQSNIVGVVLVFRDVTEQIRTEKELIKGKKLESIGVLAGGIAHDFNNILMAIMGNINLALLDINMETKTKDLLAEAEKASLRARNLTQQLLTFAKGGEPVKETSSLESVIKDSADFVLHGDKVGCQFAIPDNLWLVDIDKGQISQVVQNIVLNASQAMTEGGTITIRCKNIDTRHVNINTLPHGRKYVEIVITDSGTGMPAEVIDKVFDPYFSTKQKGSGLGLAICHSIVTKHNGYITVQSTPGTGTTFNVFLPASSNKQEKPERVETIAMNTAKAKILIMDDEQSVRDVAEAMLHYLGHEVVLAFDGAQALELYREHHDSDKPIDIIIMDLTIPGGMGGQDAVKEVLAFDPDAKVIVSSGYSNDPIMANCQQYGFCAAIVKPYQLQDFSTIINQITG